MGTVYLGQRNDGKFKQDVAIKVVRHGVGGNLLARFRDERRILAQLKHPGIAYLLDGGSLADGRPYFVMEYVQGESITTHANRKRLDVPARLELFRDVCAAVAHAHRSLVIHRRSEEHTSELQSLMRTSYAVFCLKKKTTQTIINRYTHI